MDYLFENLDPERFQKLCQSILVREFPNVQCLPVAQPDGGRDAILYYHQSSKEAKKFVVFQVKFVRKPQAGIDPHKWLIDIVKEEAPKVRRLIKEGAEGYYLLTNVAGTAHPGSGSIDQIKVILENALKVPSECWWRDDLNRRLDNAWDLKWAYPEIMTGQDMLRYVLEEGLLEHKSRRVSAIKAFVRKQYDDDKEVKFKQVQLENRLFDLFIDVPVSARRVHSDSRPGFKILEELMRDQVSMQNIEAFVYRKGERGFLGAASMLLHPITQEYISHVVLEGAPGQGKSTIAQYICQVHRMRILGMNLDTVPRQHRPLSLRIPFKIDLRHLATWLSKQNPFSPDDSKAIPENWYKSLESFLAAQVRYQSGGCEFSVTDLYEVAKISAFLLVLDGLDEVADISKRQEIVAEVIAGVNRLEASSASLQVVVTSRPAAFANSPGFPEDLFPHYELVSLTRSQVDDYANRWSKARNLSARDKVDLKRILNEKLDQPHLRDLSRNPMQLAILLTLIHARSFLPDERTALYDSYVERFFDRETEKSSVVREHRPLLIEIHQYLAWVLHSEAEQGHNRGSISIEQLRSLLFDYLKSEGHDTSLSDQLCTSAVERIVFLVSRVQGTFEFEVQPLREYFAAKFLYNTAPYSPPGAEKRGTLPDRFDAIARNFYWLNVTRFYAGCFSKGELPTLVDGLQDLAQEEGYRYISHPLLLAAMLLADWVFAQKQKSMRVVVSLILEGVKNRRAFASQDIRNDSSLPLVLPENCGRKELIEECFYILQKRPPRDYASEIISILRANAAVEDLQELWHREVLGMIGLDRTIWLEYGLQLGLVSEMHANDLEELLSNNPKNPKDLSIILRSEQGEFFEASEDRCQSIVDLILNEEEDILYTRSGLSILDSFSIYFNLTIYKHAFRFPEQISLSNTLKELIISRFIRDKSYKDRFDSNSNNSILKKCMKFVELVEKEYERPIKQWISELMPWDIVVEKSRSIWGERWANYRLANFAGMTKLSKLSEDFSNLMDQTKSLCMRIHYAKSQTENPNWWRKQFNLASSELDLMFFSLVLFTWASCNTLVSLDEIINSVSLRLADKCHFVINAMRQVVQPDLQISDETILPDKIPELLAIVLGMRAKKDQAINIYLKYFSDYQGSDVIVLEFCLKMALSLARSEAKNWHQALKIIAKLYANLSPLTHYHFSGAFLDMKSKDLPQKIAKEIILQPEKYPRQLVFLAEARYREVVASKIVPVGEIAKDENWFED